MFELVIYDCGGVLIDSERLAIKVDALVLAERFVGASDASFQGGVEDLLGRLPPSLIVGRREDALIAL